MKFQMALMGFLFSLTWIPSVQAYPWMFFRQHELPGLVELDTHVSYFFKDQATVFSGIKLDYHHPTIDINLGYNYSFLEERHYFRMSELAVIFPFISEEWKMSLGFKDVLWSEADRYWNHGLWQPRYMLDAFRPVQMGLPGLYLNYEKDVSLLFLFSYFYLPDIIIYPKLRGKQVTSKNPFFVEPFQKFQWNIGKLELFQLNRFFKPTVAFQIRHFIEDSNVSFSYAYKPVNQFQYAVLLKQHNLDLSDDKKDHKKSNSPDDKKDQMIIEGFKYSILSHHLASLEGEIALAESVSLFASLFYENPEKTYEKRWISDNFESHLTFSFLAYFQEKLAEGSETLFTLGYTKTMDDPSGKHTSNAWTEDLEPAFGRGFDWKEALSASIEYQNTNLFQGFLFRFRTNYALDNDFYALALENYFYFTPYFRMYLSGDAVFRLSNNRNVKKGTSSIEKYEDLSRRLLVGVQYVF